MLSAFVGEIPASLVVDIPEITQDGLKGVNEISNPALSLTDIPRFIVGCGTKVVEFASFDSTPHWFAISSGGGYEGGIGIVSG